MILVAMEIILVGNYEFLNYPNVCIHKMAWYSVNALASVLNHISLKRAGHQHSDQVCAVCITSLGVEV